MTRLMNLEKGGYFPMPEAVTSVLLPHLTAPHGGRVLDPCAGEGVALAHIAQQLALAPYGVELHRERAATAAATIAPLCPEGGHQLLAESYLNLKATASSFNLLYVNPPYLWADDKAAGRAEYQWLVHTRPFLQPDGVLVWVVPQHMLRHRKSQRYLVSWYRQLQVWRFPDDYFARFRQVVVMGIRNQRAQMPDAERLTQLQVWGEGEQLPVLGVDATQQWYTLPKPIVADHAFTFRGLYIDPDVALAEARQQGIVTRPDFADLVTPKVHEGVALRPLTPLKIGHLTGIIAAGHINNQVIAAEGEQLLIKGHSYKTKTHQQQRQVEADGGYSEKETYTDRVVTQITTITPEGEVVVYQQGELEAFLQRWLTPLTALVAAAYPPRYHFDLNGYEASLAKLNRDRLIPLVNKPGFLPAQAHAIAAVATQLEKENHALICGEMGVGKSVMGAAAPALLRDKGQRMAHIIVLCPPHLVQKWQREIGHVWPAAKTTQLKTIADVDRFFATEGPCFGILKETTARAGSGWHHALEQAGPLCLAHRSPREAVKVLRQSGASQQLSYAAARGLRCPTCGERVLQNGVPAIRGDFGRQRRFCPSCGGALFQESRGRQKKARYPLATYIKKRYKGQLDLLVADEAHQFKSSDSDRGYAFHRLATAARKVLGMTGTIYGGRSSSLFYLLYRISPAVRQAFTNHHAQGKRRLQLKAWVARYGILQEIETSRYDAHGKLSGNSKSRQRVKELPGGSPAMLPYLLNCSVFVSLSDMGFALPTYEEIPVPVPMSPAMAQYYRHLEQQLKDELAMRLRHDDKSLLAAYLQALLCWPDSPWRHKRVIDAKGETVAAVPALPDPAGCYPKEQAILAHIQAEKREGRRCLLLCQQTNTLDITPQWVSILAERGVKAAVLKAPPHKREAWVAQQVAEGVDVIITHPKRVETGMDLLDFPTIIWLGIEYSAYTILQANRRSWRIGQTKPVRVYFYVYQQSLQEQALHLIAAKVGAAVRINGDSVAEDSLAELDELATTDMVIALARMALEEQERSVVSLTDAFAQANAAFSQQQEMIGGYEMATTTLLEPEPAEATLILSDPETGEVHEVVIEPAEPEVIEEAVIAAKPVTPPRPLPQNGRCQAMKYRQKEWRQCQHQELHLGPCDFKANVRDSEAVSTIIEVPITLAAEIRRSGLRGNKVRGTFTHEGTTYVAVQTHYYDREATAYKLELAQRHPALVTRGMGEGHEGQVVRWQEAYYVLMGPVVKVVWGETAAQKILSVPTPIPAKPQRLVFGVHTAQGHIRSVGLDKQTAQQLSLLG